MFRKVLSLPLQELTGVESGLRVDEVQDTVTEKEPKEVDRRALTHAWNHSWSHTKCRGLQYNGQCIIITVTVLNNHWLLFIMNLVYLGGEGMAAAWNAKVILGPGHRRKFMQFKEPESGVRSCNGSRPK